MSDLESDSCYAAGEIDNYILGRGVGFEKATKLKEVFNRDIIEPDRTDLDSPASELVKKSFSCGGEMMHPSYSIGEKTATAFYLTLVDNRTDFPRDVLVSGLVDEARSFVGSLEKLSSNPETFEKGELETLRSFCLSLSENSNGLEPPYEDTPRDTNF